MGKQKKKENGREPTMRLDKFLANMQVGSRSVIKQMIRKGMVTVNGELAGRPEQQIRPETDTVQVQNQTVAYVTTVYYMLHKPAGVVSAIRDEKEQTVLDLMKDCPGEGLFPVGRLDKDTEGLLLVTNDGELAHELLSPRKHVDKVYYAKIQGRVTTDDVKQFAEGLDIKDEKKTMPAKLRILESDEISQVEVTIQEGRYHQVKRMFQAVQKKVLYLKRLSMGSLVLDPDLKPGDCRPLTRQETEQLKQIENETR